MCVAATPVRLQVRWMRGTAVSFSAPASRFLAILCTAVVVARVSHASRLVFMRTLVCAISGEFSCDRLNRRFSCEKIF